jgi:tetratricopeptide (TPR) repeat protein
MTKPLKKTLDDFDYRVECDDFLLYQLGDLIEDDRASFDDEELRRIIECGIHEHIERRLDVRAGMAMRLRMELSGPHRLLQAIEDIESPLGEIPDIIQSYTAYVFHRLEQCSELAPDERVTNAAEVLLESPEDRPAAEASIDWLGSIRSAVSARILAHVLSEPMLDEDLEAKAYEYVRGMWPLPRPYILYSLKPHTHEDIPFRWFQLLIDCDEPSSVDRILEEFLVHGNDSEFREDLLALEQLLESARDPETDEKILQVLNSESVPQATVKMLEGFLKNTSKRTKRNTNSDNPWAALDRAYAANRQYLTAARLYDAGKKAEAMRALEELLKEDPQNPLALMLKEIS